MREIKFRAWDKEDKLMCCDIETGIIFNDGSYYDFRRFLGHQEVDDYHKWVVMQYTGLKDKNGKEIYEGDIVKTDNGIYIVHFHYGSFRCYKDKYYDDYIFELSEALNRNCKVIGNIYENPELLKESER